ncbi:MAG: exosortase system-associated protein, TIGR04073 family, partial [Candidatus Omnitrophica bacterium]|nr:exosortase system-associated protein, TIGR04073 family [Candidatus Omnitrophota bacterium]
VEIPKRISETSNVQGMAAGLTWGLLRGLGYGFVRTAAGFYEVFTFPVAAPPNYEPVIQPEYVFVEEDNQRR